MSISDIYIAYFMIDEAFQLCFVYFFQCIEKYCARFINIRNAVLYIQRKQRGKIKEN